MSYKIELTSNFQKEAKRFSKKYSSFKKELSDLFELLSENPQCGTPLGNNIYKIRNRFKEQRKV